METDCEFNTNNTIVSSSSLTFNIINKTNTSSFISAVEGTFIIAIFFPFFIMLTSRAMKIKKIFKSINWWNVQQKAAFVVNILTKVLYIVLLIFIVKV
jgi:hypothetical protein